MVDLSRGAKLIVETCMGVKPGEKILVIADYYARPKRIAEAVMEAAIGAGAEAVLMVMRPNPIAGTEPPKPVAAAMKVVDAMLFITDTTALGHTNARKEASAAGVRYYSMEEVSEDELARDISPADIMLIRDNTEKLAQQFTQAKSARVTSPAGTNLTLSMEGRQGIALHPLARGFASVPDYAEATTAPLEGTADGVIVFDAEMIGWGFLLRQPLRLNVKAGRVTDISGLPEDAERLKLIAATDKNANNIAEFAIGTSHIVPRSLRGTRRDAAIAGMVHIALGRSDGLGGTTWSSIHIDGVITRASVELDGKQVLREGVLQI
ncbi:MAG: aminopeptidase [Chloroflexi bacterium]|nr:aminopeptidase [Chloroflexota bacterium]